MPILWNGFDWHEALHAAVQHEGQHLAVALVDAGLVELGVHDHDVRRPDRW